MTPGFLLRMATVRIVAMRLPSRRTFWLSAATLLVAIVVCGWFIIPHSRINHENFDRIQTGRTPSELRVTVFENSE
jgi:hypothetical protein